MLEVALALVAGGWPVFPCGLDKAPLVGTGFKARERDVEQVRQWWTTHPDALPAIVPGDGGLAALDVDSTGAAAAVDAAGFWPSGFMVATGGTSQPFTYEGDTHTPLHIYITATEQPKVAGVVVRFRSGYVIAPGARRVDRIYRVVDDGEPRVWSPIVRITPDRPPLLTDLYNRVAEAMRWIPNGDGTDRDAYVTIAHMIKGSAGDAGLGLFLEWAALYPGADPAEDERVFETITKPRAGWPELWRLAARYGFDASPEVEAAAQDDFADTPLLAIKEDARTKVQRLLSAVRDAEDGIGRSLALVKLRKAGFVYSEIKSMLTDMAPTQSDEGNPLGELLLMPELLKTPQAAIPCLVWPGLKTILAAREKTGKSTLAMAGAAAATRGDTFLDEPTTQQRVLWMSEEPLAIVVPRAAAMKADPEQFILVAMGTNPQAQLKRAVKRWSPTVVVIDTLFRFAGVEDENDSAMWMPILLLFDEVTQSGAGLLILVHSIKHSATGEYRGSSAIGGFVDAILEMKRPTGVEKVRKMSGRGRLHFGKPFSVRLLDDVGGFELLRPAAVQGTDVLQRAILMYVAKHPGKTGEEITTAMGKRKGSVSTALAVLEAAGQLVNEEGWQTAEQEEEEADATS